MQTEKHTTTTTDKIKQKLASRFTFHSHTPGSKPHNLTGLSTLLLPLIAALLPTNRCYVYCTSPLVRGYCLTKCSASSLQRYSDNTQHYQLQLLLLLTNYYQLLITISFTGTTIHLSDVDLAGSLANGKHRDNDAK